MFSFKVIKNALLGLSFGLFGVASVVASVDDSPSPVFAMEDTDRVNPLYDSYFDSIRDMMDSPLYGWNRHSSKFNTVYDYDYRSLAFKVDQIVADVTPWYDVSDYSSCDVSYFRMYRFCSDSSGYVYLYYKDYPSGSFSIEYCDFALKFSKSVSDGVNGFDVSLYNDNYIVPVNRVYGGIGFGYSNVELHTVYNAFSPASSFAFLGWSYHIPMPMYLNLDFIATYMDTFDDLDEYQSGYDVGYGNGYSDGNSAGYSSGYDVGYADGLENGSGTTMFNVFPLAASVVSLPLQFFMSGLDWTLFDGTPYAFNIATMAGSVFIILMFVGVVRLIMRFFGK